MTKPIDVDDVRQILTDFNALAVALRDPTLRPIQTQRIASGGADESLDDLIARARDIIELIDTRE